MGRLPCYLVRSTCHYFLADLFAVTAFFLAWAAVFGCRFVQFKSSVDDVQQLDRHFDQRMHQRPHQSEVNYQLLYHLSEEWHLPRRLQQQERQRHQTSHRVTVQFGMWRYQSWAVATTSQQTIIFESCHPYPGYIRADNDLEIDANWKAARAFSILAIIIGGVFLLFSLFMACSYQTEARKANLGRCRWKGYLVACLFQGLSLLLLQSSLCNDNVLMQSLSESMNMNDKIFDSVSKERSSVGLNDSSNEDKNETSQYAQSGQSDFQFSDACTLSTDARCTIVATVFWLLASTFTVLAIRAEAVEEVQNRDLMESFLRDYL